MLSLQSFRSLLSRQQSNLAVGMKIVSPLPVTALPNNQENLKNNLL